MHTIFDFILCHLCYVRNHENVREQIYARAQVKQND